MKNRIILILGCLFTITSARAYKPDSLANAQVKKAIELATGSRGRINKQEALKLFQEYAAKGHPRAMNGLGLMYLLGDVVQTDSAKAIELFTTAGKMNYPYAWQNLGIMYFYAHAGVQQDFEKAYACYEKAVACKGIAALYDAGYMLYKGLGCEQNYEKAFRYFVKGAGKGHSPCMYMLGLCFRNGYGTEVNPGEANYWLTEAEKKGYRFASDELEAETPENSLKGTRIQSNQAMTVPAQYARVRGVQPETELSGVYQGVLVEYDWSGQHIIKETPMQLTLHTDGDRVQGEWQEGENTVWLNATFKDGALLFENTRQTREDRYSPEEPILYQFTEATIQAANASLTGNIRMYSPESMEPQRPMYISLQKAGTTTIEEELKNSSLRAYPNPFSNELNLCFTLSEPAKVTVAIYDYAGRNVFMSNMGEYSAGEQRFVFTPNLAQGVYIVKVFAGKQSYQVIVMKEGGKQ